MSEVSLPAALPSSAKEALPRRFGRYQLFDRIGAGGMAEIYLARASTGLDGATRLLVVKQIHAALSGDARFAKMFAEEAKLCAGLRHANVVQIVDLGRAEGPGGTSLLYMAMEYVEGLDLNQLLRRLSQKKVPLPLEFAIFVVHEVLSALDFAHRATGPDGKRLGIVHRDVSPSNVLMSLEGEVKLCDFGIARAFGQAGDESAVQANGRAKVVGKSAYMSPEHARGEDLDARADVFSAGILLWELCAGRRLYRGSEDEMLELAKRAEVPRLPERGLPEPAQLQELLDRALDPAPGRRYESAAAMRSALDEYTGRARLFASPIRLGSFLSEHFELELLSERRERELQAQALEELTPIGGLEAPPSSAPATSRDARADQTQPLPAGKQRDDDTSPTSAPPAAASPPVQMTADPATTERPPPAPSPASAEPSELSQTIVVALGVVAVLLTLAAIVAFFFWR
jgi:serine/threonine protein kinase